MQHLLLPPQTRRMLFDHGESVRGVGRAVGNGIHRVLSRHLLLPLTMVMILILWQAITIVARVPAYLLPSPLHIGERMVEAMQSGMLWRHLTATSIVALSGFALSLVVSSVLGYALAHTRWLDGILSPMLAAIQAIPMLAIAPLIILWLGTGWLSKVVVAACITLFPMLLSTITAVRSIPRELWEVALINGANRWQLLWYVEVPLALRIYFSGVRTGLALATTGAVVAEFVSGREGLGALITIARGLFDTPLIFVALVTLAGMTLFLYLIASLLERALIHWEI